VAVKLKVYVLPRVTGDAFLLKVKTGPTADRFDHCATSVPSLSLSVIVTLSILVVPEAPLIVTTQVAVFPENVKFTTCVVAENGSIAIAADALIEKHRVKMPINSSLKILFIVFPPN
jgi:hypothetical protein